MPCSHCNINTHNIQRCELFFMNRAISIYNDGIDNAPRSIKSRELGDEWYKTNHISPNELTWSHRNITISNNYTFNTLRYLKKLRSFHLARTNRDLHYEILEINHQPGDRRYHKLYINSETNKIIHEQLPLEQGVQDYRAYCVEVNDRTRERRNVENREIIQQRNQEQLERRRAQLQAEQARASQLTAERARRQAIDEEQRLAALANREEPIEATECPVCMDELKPTNHMILRCGHQFCGDCIFKHFQKSGGTKCPMCRSEYALRVPNWLPPNANTNQPRQRHVRNPPPVFTNATTNNNQLRHIEEMLAHLIVMNMPTPAAGAGR